MSGDDHGPTTPAVLLSEEGAHVLDEAARDRGRQLYWFEGHGLEVGRAGSSFFCACVNSGTWVGGESA
jgi:hypothetical protein